MSDSAASEILARAYKPAHPLTVAKTLDHVEAHGRRFISLSPFVVIGSAGPDGLQDVSPRGGGPGFVHVSGDGRTLILPDRPGNNRLDTLKNIAAGNGEVGLMFLIPGVDDVYRVNGRAVVIEAGEQAQAFEEFGKPPRSLLQIAVREAYLHCPKALMRADLWGETHRVDRASLPTLTEMVMDQLKMAPPPVTLEQERTGLKETL